MLLVSLGGAQGQNLVSNGSFEQPARSTPDSWGYTLPDDWIQNADANHAPAIFNGSVPGWPAPEEGSQFLDIGNTAGFNAGVHQTFTVTVPGTYDLTWFDNAAIGFPHAYSVSLGGTTVDIPGETGSATWTEHELLLTLSGSVTLTFTPIPGGVDTLLDNVQVQSPNPPVPDCAGTFGLLNLALGGIALLARKSQRHG